MVISVLGLSCHYFFDKVLHLPVGYLVLANILFIVVLLLGKNFRIERKWGMIVGIVAIFLFVMALSILNGLLVEGIPWQGITTRKLVALMGGYERLDAFGTHYVPSYEQLEQIIKGILYNMTFPVLLISFLLLFRNLSKKNRVFYRGILKTIILICVINALFNIVEFMVPPVHSWLMMKGGYATGADFFTYRGMSFVLNIYINAFLNLLLLGFCFNKYLNTFKAKWLFVYFLVLLTVLIAGTRIAMITGLVQTMIQVFFHSYEKKRSKAIAVLVTIAALIGGPFLLIMIKPDIIKVLMTIVTLQDASGSAQLHLYLFFNSIDMFLRFPFGIGIGKADQGGFESSQWFNTESHALAVTVGAGIIGLFLYLILNSYLLYKSYKAGQINKDLAFIFPLGAGCFMVSIINMQIYESLLPVTFLALLYAISLVINNDQDKGVELYPKNCNGPTR